MAKPKPNTAPSTRANVPTSRAALAAAFGVIVTLTAANRDAEARDILRGGGSFSPAAAGSSSSANSTNATAAQTAAIAKRAQDTLARTTKALQSMQAMQTAARAAARNGANNLGADPNHPGQQLPNVSDGLGAGGLLVGNGWTGASAPTQTTIGGKTNVTITQTQQQSLLNWQTFNIGKNTTLTFDQSAGGADVGTWISFNKITDPTGVPSQILGSIKADGQVYIINQNGIIFGGSSQVNAHALVASSLPINDNLIARGLVNNPDLQFLFTSLAIPKLANGGTMDAFTPPDAPNTPGGKDGDVVVQAGAQLSSPTSADHVGGKIALVGPNVSNAGTISTPDGQTILAAGEQVGMVAHASTDASLRGLDVFIGQGGGTAENTACGIIEAARGNITIAGKSVNQLGSAKSTTSVSLNGSIDLQANYNTVVYYSDNAMFDTPSASGMVTLGAGSVTQILPELASNETAVGTKLALASAVNIQGETVHFGVNSQLTAPGASVDIKAGTWEASSNGYTFTYSKGQVYLDEGASIDVLGSQDVSASLSENIISVQLLGSELANSPLQRYGVLRGKTILVDVRKTGVYNGDTWYGTPLANTTGYISLIKRSVGELTVDGGSVTITAGNSVVMQAGSKIDVSGGWINYKGGTVKTTRVLSGGHIYDISQATPDIVYDGIYSGFTQTHARWNVSETFTSQLLTGAHYEAGYSQGGNGGTVSITAPSMALDGNLYGNTVAGPRQRSSGVNSNTLANPSLVPSSSALALIFGVKNNVSAFYYSPTPPNITFQSGVTQTAADPFSLDASGNPTELSAERKATVVLSPSLLSDYGFSNVTLSNVDGNITVPVGVNLATQAGGSLTLSAANIDIEGKVTAPGGALNFTVYDYSPYASYLLKNQTSGATTPAADSTRGLFTLGSKASLSTAGLIVDDRASSATAESLPLATNGGSVTITGYSVDLKEGSAVDASGGLAISGNGKRSYGSGGSIAISAGQDPTISSLLGGKLVLDANLSAYGGIQDTTVPSSSILGANLKYSTASQGGSLSILAPLVQIGGVAANNDTLLLSTDFFNEGGFSSFTLSGLGAGAGASSGPGVLISAGTVIEPTAQSRVAVQNSRGLDWETLLLPEGLRAKTTLTLNATGVKDFIQSSMLVQGDIVMEAGAVIQTGPKGSVSLNGHTVTVLGSILTPGGSIDIQGSADSSTLFNSQGQALPTVEIGSNSVLSAAGTTILIPDPRGYRSGSVTAGGSINIAGNIVAEAGAVMDVSGASGVLDILSTSSDVNISSNGSLKGAVVTPTRIDSDGGSITLKGGQELFTDATLIGAAGGPSASGGSLTLSSGRFVSPGTIKTPSDVTLSLTQSELTLPDSFSAAGQTAIGRQVVDAQGNALTGGYFAVDRFAAGGFSTLTLKGTVQFSGPVSITAKSSLTLGDSGVLFADSAVNLAAPYVSLGTLFQAPTPRDEALYTLSNAEGAYYLRPIFGTGSITVTADHIDIGNLSLQNIGKLNLIAKNGDVRGDGTLDIAGDIAMTAGQIYTPTASTFTIVAYDHDGTPGSVTLSAWGSRELPLSAGGELNIYASIINQGGVLRAPIGTINLGWDGTGTAPVDLLAGTTLTLPTTQQLTLSAGSVTSVSAVDPTTGKNLTIPYGIILNGISWIDPTGTDISTTGLPTKTINLSALKIDDQAGSTIDIRGGGDLYAYRWVSGLGGTKDILASTTSFAVIPSYQANYAPYAAYNNTKDTTANLGTDTGYVNSSLKVGDQVYLAASSGLPAGVYTLLPARYALLPGAFLVTPQSGVPTGTVSKLDGSTLVSGYRYNSLDSTRTVSSVATRFEVASLSVVKARAEYNDAYANSFIATYAQAHSAATPRLPIDSGQLVFAATNGLTLEGSLLSKAPTGGRGGWVDISSPVDILIGGAGVESQDGVLVLDATKLSAFGAESLLIGGVRNSAGTVVDVTTNNLTVDNSGSPLTGPDVILVANKNLTVAPGADVEQKGKASTGAGSLAISGIIELKKSGESITLPHAGAKVVFPEGTPGDNKIITTSDGTITYSDGSTITFSANTAIAVTAGATVTLTDAGTISFAPDGTGGVIRLTIGDGLLLRVASDASTTINRSGVTTYAVPKMVIGAGAVLSGESIILDSTYATTLNPSAILSGNAVSLNSGQISLEFGNQNISDLKRTSGEYTTGLVLSGGALQTIVSSAKSLSLLSYSSIDIYGSGSLGDSTFKSLALHAADIRGFNSGAVTFSAQNILLDNSAGAKAPKAVDGQSATLAGTLVFDAVTMQLGSNQLNVEHFDTVSLIASGGILTQGSGGFSTEGALTISSPLLTGATLANQTISAGGALTLQSAGENSRALVTGGLGASLTLQGASVTANSDIVLPSGKLELHATRGDLSIGGRLDVAGTEQKFYDLIKYTSGGSITLASDAGNVNLAAGSTVTVAARPGAGNAGSLSISAPEGSLIQAGVLHGQGGAGGSAGTFSLDVRSLPSLAQLDAILNNAAFTLSRSFRVRTGNVLVDGYATAHTFSLAVDQGAITVAGTIDAHGTTGGTIKLSASQNITLQAGSLLNAAGKSFDDAGKGGAVSLETTLGRITLSGGSTIDLSVLANTDSAANAALGKFNGTLHLRAPQIADASDVAIDPLAGSLVNASSIVVEGFFAQDAKTADVAVIDDYKQAALDNATSFMANATTIQTRLLALNSGIANVFHVRPGEEIDNSLGDLVLNSDWDLSTWRFGTQKAVSSKISTGVEPGILTLRAKGSIIFNGMLSDGFGDSAGTVPKTTSGAAAAWKEALLPLFSDKTSQLSWSYRITSGADTTAADYRQVLPLAQLGADTGAILIGVDAGTNTAQQNGANATTDSVVAGHYQVIRTGAGDIDISAGRDVKLLNQFATIYTAGTLVPDPTMNGTFDVPILNIASNQTGDLGVVQESPAYPAQYSYRGGNVTITAQEDILHETLDVNGNPIADSERQLPNNWLYRRGYVDPATGKFGKAAVRKNIGGDVASTTWWVDFSNFFEGVGALGGGNVTMIAGHNVTNVDAVVPTNARMAGKAADKTPIAPNAANLLELGGGDLVVRAGNNIDGGVYYIERGAGILSAGNQITTNSTRTPSLGTITGSPTDLYPSQTWLPTTLFLGKGSFDVQAGGDLLLGPVANVFLMPEGYSNTYWYKTYFSTYASTDSVTVSSLGGSVTLRESATLPSNVLGTTTPLLEAWLTNVSLFQANTSTVSSWQPWLRLDETSVTSFDTVVSLMPPTLKATAFSGDINIVGDINLWPSSTGTVDLAAAGSINGVQISGITALNSKSTYAWSSSSISLSDADPSEIPGITSPYAYQRLAGSTYAIAKATDNTFLAFIDSFFKESGSTQGDYAVLQTKQTLHGSSVLHTGDANPVHLYAQAGDISGLTLFSGKAARIVAGRDVTDIALYLQNIDTNDISVVSAGRDIIAYDPNSALRVQAQTAATDTALGNALDLNETPQAGDIQIGGPGTIEVLAGRNLDLGVGLSNSDGTGVGLVSIGNARNPALPFDGADIVAAAGIGTSFNLDNSQLDFASFISQFLNPATASSQAARYLPVIGAKLDITDATNAEIWTAFGKLSSSEQHLLALDIFYLVLRDAGRDHNDASSAGYKNYDAGNKAIAALFPTATGWKGDVSLTSREIKTKNGGNINLIAPGGKLTVGYDISGSQPLDQGILTEHGGNISIFTQQDVAVGTSRIFTLRGGNEIIWSSVGNIAAGASSKTVQSAPPTRVLVDPQSGDVKTDISGLATGGGIGVLQSISSVQPGDVDLIAPVGNIDAGDAGIRATGNLNISAVQVLNASNIQVGGASTGTPAVAAPTIGSLQMAAPNTSAASNSAASEQAAAQRRNDQAQQEDIPSIINVEVLGYGGGDGA